MRFSKTYRSGVVLSAQCNQEGRCRSKRSGISRFMCRLVWKLAFNCLHKNGKRLPASSAFLDCSRTDRVAGGPPARRNLGTLAFLAKTPSECTQRGFSCFWGPKNAPKMHQRNDFANYRPTSTISTPTCWIYNHLIPSFFWSSHRCHRWKRRKNRRAPTTLHLLWEIQC